MTNRKGGTIDYRSNFPNKKPTGDGDYEISYYGDENFLKSSAFENEKNILQSRICDLEWRNKLLIGAMTVLMILSFAALVFCVILYLNIAKYQERLSELQRSQNVEEFVSDITLALVGGDGRTYGNLFVDGSPVCDDPGWDNNAATVACKMLGFKRVTFQILYA